jgi:hypothetical protein
MMIVVIFAKFAFGNEQHRHSYLQLESYWQRNCEKMSRIAYGNKNTWSSVPLYVTS